MAKRNGKLPAPAWANRITGYGEEAPDQLLANPGNWRTHNKQQQDALSGILAEVGIVQNVLVNKRTGHLVDGHLRVTLAMREHQPTVPVTYVDLSPAEEAEILATLDPVAAMAGADREKLDALLREVNTGNEAVQRLLADVAAQSGLTYGAPKEETADPDALIDRAAELQEKWGTGAGQIWQLGPHRLGIGDSTDTEWIARVVNGSKIAATITDPPYNVGKEYRENFSDDQNAVEYEKFSRGWFRIARDVSECVVFTPGTGKALANIPLWFSIERPYWMAIWAKKNTVTHSPIGGFQAWEPILIYGKPKKKIGQDLYDIPIGMQFQDGTPLNELHPTPKILKLWVNLMEDFTNGNEVVYEPFSGSGTTLVACQQTGRVFRGNELEAPYAAVSIQRWVDVTGLEPVLSDQ